MIWSWISAGRIWDAPFELCSRLHRLVYSTLDALDSALKGLGGTRSYRPTDCGAGSPPEAAAGFVRQSRDDADIETQTADERGNEEAALAALEGVLDEEEKIVVFFLVEISVRHHSTVLPPWRFKENVCDGNNRNCK